MEVIEMRVGGGPEVLQVADRPLPEPGPNEVRVRAHAIGISSADILVRKGIYNWMPPLPAVPGNELAGTIDAVGSDVSGVKTGQYVLVSSRELPFRGGCYAEAICVPASAVFRLPEGILPRDAVSLPNFQLAGALLYESGVIRPKSIVTWGASGGVGLAIAQLARADEIQAIGIVSTEQKRSFVRAAGVPDVILRSEDVVGEVKRLTGDRGVDVAYSLGGTTVVQSLDMLAPLGTVVSFSMLGGLIPDADIFGALRKRLGNSLGVRCYSVHTLDHRHEQRRALMERAIALMGEGRLQPPPPTLMPLREAARAHAMMEAGETIGKVVLIPKDA